jgi:hypothetical protein
MIVRASTRWDNRETGGRDHDAAQSPTDEGAPQIHRRSVPSKLGASRDDGKFREEGGDVP